MMRAKVLEFNTQREIAKIYVNPLCKPVPNDTILVDGMTYYVHTVNHVFFSNWETGISTDGHCLAIGVERVK